MWGLIYKDFYQQARNLGIMILITLVLVVYAAATGGGAGVIAVVAIVVTLNFVLRNGYIEDRNNALSFLSTLPIGPRVIVAAKYASTALAALGIAVFGVVAARMVALWGLPVVAAWSDLLLMGLISAAMALVLGGVYLLLFFRLGYAGAGTYTRIFIVVLAFAAVALVKANGNQPLLPGMLKAMAALQPLPPVALLALAAAVWYGCSFALAVRVFSRREPG
ncbi:MAG: ABC-2 transporter permease [Bacillota bacterium]|nr:ABC-2 transporter permease [Bacillota bacterium]